MVPPFKNGYFLVSMLNFGGVPIQVSMIDNCQKRKAALFDLFGFDLYIFIYQVLTDPLQPIRMWTRKIYLLEIYHVWKKMRHLDRTFPILDGAMCV